MSGTFLLELVDDFLPVGGREDESRFGGRVGGGRDRDGRDGWERGRGDEKGRRGERRRQRERRGWRAEDINQRVVSRAQYVGGTPLGPAPVPGALTGPVQSNRLLTLVPGPSEELFEVCARDGPHVLESDARGEDLGGTDVLGLFEGDDDEIQVLLGVVGVLRPGLGREEVGRQSGRFTARRRGGGDAESGDALGESLHVHF